MKQERKIKPKSHKSVRLMTTHIGNKITFQPQYIVIPPDSRGEITVTLNWTHEEEISEILEVLVQNSQSQYIKLNANIQKLKVCLNRYSVDLGKIYAGIKQTIDSSHPQAIILKNYGNIPAKFQWNEKIVPDQLKTMFEPARGTIAPHSEFVVNVRLTSYVGGDLSEMFICDVTDLDFPLGFWLTANVFGLRVAHVLPDFVVEAQKAALAMNMTSTKSKFMTSTIIKEDFEEPEEITEEQKDEK